MSDDDKNTIVDPPPSNGPRLSLVGAGPPPSTIRARAQRDNPLVRVDHDLDLTVEDAVSKLITHKNVYQRNERLVEVLKGRIREIPPAVLRERMTSVSTFVGSQKSGSGDKAKMVPKLPSDQILHAVYQRGDWNARELIGVTDVPLVRANGTILQEPGYDRETKFVYAPSILFPRVADAPSRDQCIEALNTVLEPLHMFPWKRNDNNLAPSLSAYLSMIMTMMMVSAIKTNIPGFIVSANLKGTGKSKLAYIASIIVTGKIEQTLAFVEDDEENRKRVTAAVKKDRRIIIFDNVSRKVSGDTLDMLLTTRRYSDRILGTNENIECDVNSVTCWTGNNLEAEGDTTRRVIPIEIETSDINPEERRFEFDPVTMTFSKRVEMVTALLTIIRGWYAAGCPKSNKFVMGSYEEWSGIIPEILVWLGVSNPLETRKQSVIVTDKLLIRICALAGLWESTERALQAPNGITVQDVVRFIYPERTEATMPNALELRAAYENATGEFNKRDVSKHLSYTLRLAHKRVIDASGSRFEVTGMTHGNRRWSVVKGQR